ncbi:MAG: hypothetical protein ABIG44_08025 [Planctomycetota bacterium]
MIGKLSVAFFVAVCVSATHAEPYWVAWEGDTYPEDDGWERTAYGGGAERWFEDGSLVLDGLASTDISDFYRNQRPTAPNEGEVFVMEWRLRVDEVHGFADPGVSITSEGQAALTLVYTANSIYSLGEGLWINFAPGTFHDYSLTSADLVTYTLHIDGQLAHTGQFDTTGWESGVEWGDVGQGARSLSTWDYVRFGVVPEPGAGPLLGLAGLTGLTRRIQA